MFENDTLRYASSLLEVWRSEGKEILMRTQGTSMLPLIKPGDELRIRLIDPDRLRRGEVFAFFEEDHVVVHRCVWKSVRGGSRCFCQKGDNSPGWSWVPERNVIGRVEGVRSGARELNLVSWPWTWLSPVVGFGAVLSISFRGMVRRLRASRLFRVIRWMF